MEVKAQKIFYFLSGFLLMTALFVLQPSNVPQVAELQNEMKHQFSVGWQQTIGDGPYFDSIALVFDGTTAFYDRSSERMIALLSQPESDQDLYYVFHTVYLDFAKALGPRSLKPDGNKLSLPPADKFMTEQALDNIVPDITSAKILTGAVLGTAKLDSDVEPLNKTNSWVTLRDNFTGQIYCLAIYNGEINKYLGACKYDYN